MQIKLNTAIATLYNPYSDLPIKDVYKGIESKLATVPIIFDGAIFKVSLNIFLVLLVAVINPLWFRDGFFRWTESSVYKITQWRNYRVYSIYLGADPQIWHTLKGNNDNS